MDYIKVFKRAHKWIMDNTIEEKGIVINSAEKKVYPEVTGYYIPTLLKWGEKERAKSFASYLCSIQKMGGSWYDAYDNDAYVFDSAQILKGLLAIRDMFPDVDVNIRRGCDWLISNITEEGRLVTPCRDAWGNDDNFCSELIHLYCLTPLIEAGKVTGKDIYIELAEKALNYYKKNHHDKIVNFSLLSHFYAYVMEGLLDLGEYDLVAEAMNNIKKYKVSRGMIPAQNNVKWVCSTGLFQLALVWYKMGELEEGNRQFEQACRLQNSTGGWYGGYPSSVIAQCLSRKQRPFYFPDAEISWANKYFLDALYEKCHLEFEKQADAFLEYIDKKDERYITILNIINEQKAEKVLDAGCGKGRYLKNLREDVADVKFYGMDLSEKVMQSLPDEIEKIQGTLTSIPFEDETFDVVYSCEAVEHAINVEAAISELIRITKKGGVVVVIDKSADKLGQMEIEDWEQWLADDEMGRFVEKQRCRLEINKDIGYDDKRDGLFHAWVIYK